MKVVAFATVRLNSQRVPRKNMQPVGSKPLCRHVLDTALQVRGIDEVYVYCSDEAIREAMPKGARFLKRAEWLDGNDIKARDTYTAFVNDVDADVYVALLTTAPFIRKETLQDALDRVLSGEHDSAFAAKRLQTFAWYKGRPLNYDVADIPRTQDLEPVYAETSSFFIFTGKLWKEHSRRIGFTPYIREVGEIEGVDIDTPEDLYFARIIAEHVLHV